MLVLLRDGLIGNQFALRQRSLPARTGIADLLGYLGSRFPQGVGDRGRSTCQATGRSASESTIRRRWAENSRRTEGPWRPPESRSPSHRRLRRLPWRRTGRRERMAGKEGAWRGNGLRAFRWRGVVVLIGAEGVTGTKENAREDSPTVRLFC
ncbi:hypothetical protein NL676_019186 [Syzygium grande]|nr:hypothetical protein NL676_019186 [Syzygium grande]